MDILLHELHMLMREVARRCSGGQLPSSYLVIDIETSGLNWKSVGGRKPDVVVQIGYAAVRDRKIVRNDCFYISRPPGTMSKEASDVTGITDDILAKEGVEPSAIYPQFLQLVELYRSSGGMFVGHNMISFDAPFLAEDFKREGLSFAIKSTEYVDSGMLFKAAQLRTAPRPAESLHDFFLRVKETRSRVKWKLTAAIETLGLRSKHGLDLAKAHDAGFDCMMTYLLFEELRRLTEVQHS